MASGQHRDNAPKQPKQNLRDWEDAKLLSFWKKGWYRGIGVLAKHSTDITTKPNSSHRNTLTRPQLLLPSLWYDPCQYFFRGWRWGGVGLFLTTQ